MPICLNDYSLQYVIISQVLSKWEMSEACQLLFNKQIEHRLTIKTG